jgi:hypothetical protein
MSDKINNEAHWSRRGFLAASAALAASIFLPEDAHAGPQLKITPKAPTEDQPPSKELSIEERHARPWIQEYPFIYSWMKGLQFDVVKDTHRGAYLPESWTWATALIHAEGLLNGLHPDMSFNVGVLKEKKGLPPQDISFGSLVHQLDLVELSKMEKLNTLLNAIDRNQQQANSKDWKVLYPHLCRWMNRIWTIEKNAYQQAESPPAILRGPQKHFVSLDVEDVFVITRSARTRMDQHAKKLFSESLPPFIEGQINSLYAYRLNEFYHGKNLDLQDRKKRARYEDALHFAEISLGISFPSQNPEHVDKPKKKQQKFVAPGIHFHAGV